MSRTRISSINVPKRYRKVRSKAGREKVQQEGGNRAIRTGGGFHCGRDSKRKAIEEALQEEYAEWEKGS